MTENQEPAQEQPRAETDKGLTDPDPEVRAAAAQAARDAGDSRPLSQIEGEALAAAEEPRDLTQPDVPYMPGDGSPESAQAYADAGIAGAPGTVAPGAVEAPAQEQPAEPEAQPGAEGDPGVSAFGQPAAPPAQETPGGF